MSFVKDMNDDNGNVDNKHGSLWQHGQRDPVIVIVDSDNNEEDDSIILSGVSVVVCIVTLLPSLLSLSSLSLVLTVSAAAIAIASLCHHGSRCYCCHRCRCRPQPMVGCYITHAVCCFCHCEIVNTFAAGCRSHIADLRQPLLCCSCPITFDASINGWLLHSPTTKQHTY